MGANQEVTPLPDGSSFSLSYNGKMFAQAMLGSDVACSGLVLALRQINRQQLRILLLTQLKNQASSLRVASLTIEISQFL